MIPAGSTVSNATMNLYVESTYNASSIQDCLVHPLTAEWAEMVVTWLKRTVADNWSSEGGTYSSSIDNFAFSSLTNGQWLAVTLPPSLVENWINDSANNRGLIMAPEWDTCVGSENPYPWLNILKLSSSESATVSNRPKLEITYTPSGNMNPIVSLEGTATYTLPRQPMVMTAAATDLDGSVTNVEFYANGSLIGEDNTAPYTCTNDFWQGTYSLTAVAYDNDTGSSTSPGITLISAYSLYETDMNSDPGWTLNPLWAFGTPTGASCEFGEPDPTNGFTGSNVIGYNLNGQYESDISAKNATTPAFDCRGYTGVRLTCRTWLGVEGHLYDNAKIRVSNNGSNWTTVWANPEELELHAGYWVYRDIDISSVADGHSTVYVRWVMGGTDFGINFCGWNIDDVRVTGYDPSLPVLTYSADTFIEAYSDGGIIDNSITISLTNDTFTGISGGNVAGNVIVSNLPADLTAVFIKDSDSQLTATLTGTAVNHGDSDDLSNLTFTFKDSAFAGGTASNVFDYVKSDLKIDFDPPVIFYSQNMDSDPGWSCQGQWAHGQPLGQGGEHGNPDPSSGYTGSSVYGYDLNGDYSNDISSVMYLTTPPIDCSCYGNTAISFQRWLGVEKAEFDHASLEVSNGNGWVSVWTNGWAAGVEDSAWTKVTYDISTVADGVASVQIRWGMGTTDEGWTYCGWNIDDVMLLGDVLLTTNGTPYTWLQGHGITTNQETADISDSDGDGALTWEEYRAGTDPTNAGSVFVVIDIDYSSTSNCIVWYGTTNSGVATDFIMYRATNLLSPTWLPISTNARSTTGTNIWWDDAPPQGVPLFYRPALP